MISIQSLLKEWLAVNGVHVYFQDAEKATQENIRVTLLEFLFIRQFSTLLAKMLGVFTGAIKRKVSIRSIANIH